MLSRALEELDLSVPRGSAADPALLRGRGRVVIDTGLPDSSPETWPNTQEGGFSGSARLCRPRLQGIPRATGAS